MRYPYRRCERPAIEANAQRSHEMVTSSVKNLTVSLISFSSPRSPCDAGAAPVCVQSFRPPRIRNQTHPYSSLSLQKAGVIPSGIKVPTGLCRERTCQVTMAGRFPFQKTVRTERAEARLIYWPTNGGAPSVFPCA
ncbi:unnamed protein product [Ectocarpus sp. 12 AP-2014]